MRFWHVHSECLNLAKASQARSVAFCCISTGVFGYPNEPAAQVALQTVKRWLDEPQNGAAMDGVVFNVFLQKDLEIYERLAPLVFAPDAHVEKNKANLLGEGWFF